MIVQLADAEITIDHVTSVIVDVGTRVDLGSGWVATVTLAGALCGCGKGVLCPLNPQVKAAEVEA